MLACHRRRTALPYTPGDCVKWPYTPLTLHTSCPRPPIYLYSYSRSHARQGSADEEGADLQGATTWRNIHWTTGWETTKRVLHSIVAGCRQERNFQVWVLEKWTHIHAWRAHPGMQISQRQGGAGCLEGGPPGVRKTGSWKTHPCPPPQGHEMMPAPPLNSIWQYCGCFYFVYFFKRRWGEEG